MGVAVQIRGALDQTSTVLTLPFLFFCRGRCYMVTLVFGTTFTPLGVTGFPRCCCLFHTHYVFRCSLFAVTLFCSTLPVNSFDVANIIYCPVSLPLIHPTVFHHVHCHRVHPFCRYLPFGTTFVLPFAADRCSLPSLACLLGYRRYHVRALPAPTVCCSFCWTVPFALFCYVCPVTVTVRWCWTRCRCLRITRFNLPFGTSE